jgi:hypothetical protein
VRRRNKARGRGSGWPQNWPALIAWVLDDWSRVLRSAVLLTAVVTAARYGGHPCDLVMHVLVRLVR